MHSQQNSAVFCIIQLQMIFTKQVQWQMPTFGEIQLKEN